MEPTTAGDAVPEPRLEQELRMVREAIVLVASRRFPRVTVAGLGLSEAILEPALRLALDAGVRLVPLWTADGARLDFRVEEPAP